MLNSIEFPKNHFRNLQFVRPNWSKLTVTGYTIRSLLSFLIQRIDTILMLLTNLSLWKFKIYNQGILQSELPTKPAVYVSIHAGSYPLIAKLYAQKSKGNKFAVPFYGHNNQSIFKLFKSRFHKYGIEIIQIGGAMKQIDPILHAGGSIILFLDAALPAKHTQQVKFFNQTINLTTGSYFLSQTYHLPIVPVYIVKRGLRTVEMHMQKSIDSQNKSQQEVMDQIAQAIEKMISKNLYCWQAYDDFLWRHAATSIHRPIQ